MDSHGLRQEHVGKHLRLELANGEVDEIKLLDVTVCDPPQPCCGIVYTVLTTNRPRPSKAQGGTYWTAFSEIDNFQLLGD